jgi:type II secretory pathway pseudopilin PulG
VAAIIAVLAAIAGPNFPKAQVRSKAARVKIDMR